MRKWLVALMIVFSVALGAVVVGIRMSADRVSPEIIFSDDKSTVYEKDMDPSLLLEGVTAIDDTDGDVSNTLTVEKVYEKNAEEVVVVFVAKDSSKNVTKKDFVMQIGNTMSEETAEPDETGEDQTLAEENQETELEEEEEGQELTKEEEAKKVQEEKIDSLSPEAPRFYLTTYYLEIPAGTSIDKLSFVSDIQDNNDSTNDLYRKIQILGDVDIYTPGTYEITYYVIDSVGNMSNEAVLTIVVQ